MGITNRRSRVPSPTLQLVTRNRYCRHNSHRAKVSATIRDGSETWLDDLSLSPLKGNGAAGCVFSSWAMSLAGKAGPCDRLTTDALRDDIVARSFDTCVRIATDERVDSNSCHK